MHDWHLKLFGGLTATRGALSFTRFRTRKTAALLAYLALRPEPHSREELIDLFWRESDLVSGQANLRSSLSALRRQLEGPGTTPGEFLQASRMSVALTGAVRTDVAAFESALQQRDDAATVSLYEGELLRGYYEDWIFPLRRQFESLYLAALERHLAQLEQTGAFDNAIAAVRRGLQLAPDWEHGEQLLASLVSGAARQSSAHPGPEPTSLAAEVNPSPNVAGARRVFLPSAVLKFFGREPELSKLCQKWEAEPLPIVITGFGGVGKSRLALETAQRTATALQSRGITALVAYVPLAAISSVDGVSAAILEVMGVVRKVQDTPWELLLEALRATPGAANYLVFDNCEHLLPELAIYFERLLKEAPGTHLLMTSRVRVDVSGIFEIPLEPLPLSSGHDMTPEQLLCNPGIALFANRAALVRPDFAVTSGNAAMISQLCHRLEGLPLALELTAARASSLSPRQMLERLEDRFAFLTSSRRNALERHRSLQATLDWSVELLPPELTRFWRRLSVFRGGFTADSAAAVAQDDYAVHQLSQLRTVSLVAGAEQGEELRCSLLETLREYGDAQIDEAERADLRQRHAAYFTIWADRAAAESGGPEAGLWLGRSVLESENLRAAFEWTLEHDAVSANRLGLAAGRIYMVRGLFYEAADILSRAVQVNQSSGAEMTATLMTLGQAEIMQDRLSEARPHLEKAMHLSLEAGDDAMLANATGLLMLVLRNQRNPEEGWLLGQQALAAARRHAAKTGDQRTLLSSLIPFSAMWQMGPSHEVYEGLMLETLRLADELKDEWTSTYGYFGLAMLRWEDGRYAESEGMYHKCLEIAVRLGDTSGTARAYWGLAYTALRTGRTGEARQLFHTSLELTVKAGIRWGVPQIASFLAEIAILEGRGRQAAAVLLAVIDTQYPLSVFMQDYLVAAMQILRTQIPTDEFLAYEAEAASMTYEELLARAQAL